MSLLDVDITSMAICNTPSMRLIHNFSWEMSSFWREVMTKSRLQGRCCFHLARSDESNGTERVNHKEPMTPEKRVFPVNTLRIHHKREAEKLWKWIRLCYLVSRFVPLIQLHSLLNSFNSKHFPPKIRVIPSFCSTHKQHLKLSTIRSTNWYLPPHNSLVTNAPFGEQFSANLLHVNTLSTDYLGLSSMHPARSRDFAFLWEEERASSLKLSLLLPSKRVPIPWLGRFYSYGTLISRLWTTAPANHRHRWWRPNSLNEFRMECFDPNPPSPFARFLEWATILT